MSFLPLITFGLYLAAFAGILVGPSDRRIITLAWVLGCLLHAWELFAPIGVDHAFAFTFFNAMALTAWLINVLVLIWTAFRPTWHLGLVTLPCAFASVWIEPSMTEIPTIESWEVLSHILISLIAYGALMLAGAQAMMLLLKERALGPDHLADSRTASMMPALDRMDSLLMELIAFGLIMLSIGLVIGGIALKDLFAPGLLHKTVFSSLAWLTLVTLLWGRWRFGWRGRLAASITLAGMILLILGFLGTKLVLEIILGR